MNVANPEGGGVATARLPFRAAASAAIAFVVVDLAWLIFRIGGSRATTYFSDLSGCLCITIAFVACLRALRRADGRTRRAWSFLVASTVMFAFGEFTWTMYEVVLRRTVPFPSAADAGYLIAYPLAAIAAICFPTTPVRLSSRIRTTLDGAIIAGSLFYLGWAVVLGPLYRAGGGSLLERSVGLAYPTGDVALMAILLFVFTRSGRGARSPLVLLAVGLAALAVSDSTFAVMTLHNSYATGTFTDAGWNLGYLLIALAALRPTAAGFRRKVAQDSWLSAGIPYLAVVLVVLTAAAIRIEKGTFDAVLFWGTLAIILAVIARQLVSVIENNALLHNLEAQVAEREELIRRAFHDPLTGLANRTLFRDRLEHAVDRAARNRRAVCVVYCDIDNFKAVNDRYGHAVGDIVLAGFAERVVGILRRGDTVARLGGDEFAIVIEDGDGERVAERVLEELEVPFDLEGMSWVMVSASVGVATNDHASDPDDMLRCADIAMYAAKKRGKRRYEVYEPSMLGLGEPPTFGVG